MTGPVLVRDEDGNTVGQGAVQDDGSIIVTPTLVQFLHARLDEDEAAAGNVESPGVWETDRTAVSAPDTSVTDVALVGSEDPHGQREWVTLDICGSGSVQLGDAGHIARWHPDRVLADCAARRRIVEPWGGASTPSGGYDSRTDEDDWLYGIHAEAHDVVLRFLALAYAGHPEYREEWAP